MNRPIKLTLEHLMGLLQGKKLYYSYFMDGKEDITEIIPPQGTITMTYEEFEIMRHAVASKAEYGMMEMFERVLKNSQMTNKKN